MGGNSPGSHMIVDLLVYFGNFAPQAQKTKVHMAQQQFAKVAARSSV
jgi:hypothetical protein